MNKKTAKLGLTKKKQSDIKLLKLKKLSKWLLNPNINNEIQSIIDDKDFEKNYKYKLFSYLIHSPKIIFYCDQYLNGIYDFHRFKSLDWLNTFSLIIKYGNIKHLHFSKYQSTRRDNFTILLNKIYNELQKQPLNQEEINNLFILYETGHIQEHVLDAIKETLYNKEIKNIQKKTKKEILKDFHSINDEKIEELSNEVKTFIDTIKTYISNRKSCNSCPLFAKGSVILDTNVKSPKKVDIVIIYDYPKSTDLKNNKPFTDKPGLLFRKYFNILVQKYNLKYIITSSLLCHSPSDNIPQMKKLISNCKGITEEIHNAFPSTLKVLVGSNVLKDDFGIKGGISKLNGKIFDDRFLMYSPQEAVLSETKIKKFEESFYELDNILKKKNIKQSNIEKFDENDVDRITNVERGLTLFDVKTLGNEVVFILIDNKGNKKYLFEKFKFPVYIKSGQYQNCNYITDKFEAICHLSKEEKSYFQQLLNKNLKQLIIK